MVVKNGCSVNVMKTAVADTVAEDVVVPYQCLHCSGFFIFAFFLKIRVKMFGTSS